MVKYKIIPCIMRFTDGPLHKQLTIFPNPAASFITIESTTEPIEKVVMFDSSGRLVKDDANPGQRSTAMNINPLPVASIALLRNYQMSVLILFVFLLVAGSFMILTNVFGESGNFQFPYYVDFIRVIPF